MADNERREVPLSKVIASDLPRGVALLGDLTTNLNSVLVGVKAFAERVKNGDMKSKNGLGLLDLKNQAFLSYLTNLAYMMLRKLKGAKLEDDPCIDRLVELRVLMERIRPLEDKLKYQLDKYVKIANEGALSADDPLRLRGNLDNIGSSSDEEDEENEGKGKKETEKDEKEDDVPKIYKVPKIAPVHYDEENKNEEARKARKRALSSAMMRDALYEHTDEPEVVYNMDTFKHKALKKRRELEAYEEDNFLRKSLSKRERAEMSAVTTVGTLGSELLGFSNVDALQDGFDPSVHPSKKRKIGGKASKGKKKGKGKVKGKKGFKKKNR